MRLKTVLLIGAAMVPLLAAPAHATMYTVTISGTIGSGFDTSGLFGPPKTSLAGKPYVLSITIDNTLTTMTDNTPYNLRLESNGGDRRGAFISVTVGGVTWSRFAGDITSLLYLATQNDNTGLEGGVAATARGTDAAGGEILAQVVDTSTTYRFVPNLTLNQSLEHEAAHDGPDEVVASFSVDGHAGEAYFSNGGAVTVTYGPGGPSGP